VGCGTGIASAQVAERGVRVVAVEPDERMAQWARARGTQVTISSLEDWTPQPCDVMFAAQSWHWVDATRGAQVAAAAIRPGGRWVAFWNHESDPAIDDALHAVFRRVAPSLLEEQTIVYAGNDEFRQRIASGLAATNAFEDMEIERVEWVDRVDSTRFVDRLGSYSANRLLATVDRRRVRDALIEAFGDRTQLQVRYVTEVFTATRRT
jgi:trans-aconitate methyltransferase